jgi:hypothetical protein
MAQPVPSDATGHAAPSLRSSRRTTWRSPWYSTMSPKRSSSAWISVMTGCPPFLVTSSSGAGRSASSLLTNSNDDRTVRRPRPWSQRGHSARTGAWSDGPQGSDQRQKNGRLLCLPLCPTKELRLQNATGCQRSPGCPRVWPCSIARPGLRRTKWSPRRQAASTIRGRSDHRRVGCPACSPTLVAGTHEAGFGERAEGEHRDVQGEGHADDVVAVPASSLPGRQPR